jgi:hypothetical protein
MASHTPANRSVRLREIIAICRGVSRGRTVAE